MSRAMQVWENEHLDFIQRKRIARMGKVDALSPELRQCVHEYGLSVVNAIMECGVTKPNRIRHIVETVLDEFSPTRGSSSHQGPRIPHQYQHHLKHPEGAA